MQFDFNNHLNNEILQQNRLKARSYFIPYENKVVNTGNIASANEKFKRVRSRRVGKEPDRYRRRVYLNSEAERIHPSPPKKATFEPAMYNRVERVGIIVARC